MPCDPRKVGNPRYDPVARIAQLERQIDILKRQREERELEERVLQHALLRRARSRALHGQTLGTLGGFATDPTDKPS
jgi:hypothetical protein